MTSRASRQATESGVAPFDGPWGFQYGAAVSHFDGVAFPRCRLIVDFGRREIPRMAAHRPIWNWRWVFHCDAPFGRRSFSKMAASGRVRAFAVVWLWGVLLGGRPPMGRP